MFTGDIREATRTDAPALHAILSGLADYYFEKATPQWFIDVSTVAAFEARLCHSEYAHWLAACGNQVVGYVAFKRPAHVYHLFVNEAFHRQGIALRLFQTALVGLFPSGHVPEITVRSSIYAVPFYQRLGFLLVGQKQYSRGLSYQSMVLPRKH